ncbi:MAG TPA: glycosyltransferase family 4 protein [Azospirillum sp.]|nr:glycosyltransferase family 4 protein [Azospirillum sp.]
MPPTAAIYFHPDAYSVTRKDLKGRHSAGAGFLRAFARHHAGERLFCYTETRARAVEFAKAIGAAAGRPRPTAWIPLPDVRRLAEPGCLFLPGPGFGEYVWPRRFFDQRAYSLCGVTHTVSTFRVMDMLGDYLIAPLQPWDALVVTSRPARDAIVRVLDGWGEYLGTRMGARPSLHLRLPVIPLGVDCDRFADTPERRAAGARLRQEHGIAPEDVVVLFFGRLSFHAKAHPLPMFLACEQAQARTRRKIHLILTGGSSNPEIGQEFADGARRYCPSVNTIILDGSDPGNAEASWTAADIFLSLSDNIQETFGLTPIEAMAAGLPVIVSDWDGYRDTITDGEVGFRIPTLIPPTGSGRDLALRHMIGVDSSDRYLGYVSQATAVDATAATGALLRLIEDGDLRRRMGEAGRRRAQALYDWSAVMAAYEGLWADLAQARAREPEVAPLAAGAEPAPLRADPFGVFQGFATRQFGLGYRLSCPHGDPHAALARILAASMNTFAATTLLPPEESLRLLQHVHGRERSLEDVTALFPPDQADRVGRTVAWLVKCALLTARLG